MRKSRYSEEQIIGMIREHEAGVTTKQLCRKYGISLITGDTYRFSLPAAPGFTGTNAIKLPEIVSVPVNSVSVPVNSRLRRRSAGADCRVA